MEEKVDQLTPDCSIKIKKVRLSLSRRVKYATCSIYKKGDWSVKVDYIKTPMLNKFDGSTCVVDVRSVDVKGIKRKLLLTNDGEVYKLKKLEVRRNN